MIDLSLNDNFSVHLDDTHGLAVSRSLDEFEQAVAIALTEYLHSNVIGKVGEETIRQRLRLQASRVAREKDRLAGIESIEVRPSPTKPNVYELRIVYNSDEDFNMQISE